MASLHTTALPPNGKEVVIEERTPSPDDPDEAVNRNLKKKLGTSHDRHDMRRMGKIQELRVCSSAPNIDITWL
jgi:hypothetical protein